MINLLQKKTEIKGNQVTESSLTTFLNPVSYLQARKHAQNYEQFDRLLADGWLFVAALKAVGINTQRHSFDMTSLAPVVFQQAIKNRQSVYFIGAKPAEISNFIKVIEKHFPNLNILGYRDGYFKDLEERNSIIQKLHNLSPDIVIAGLGAPLQEKFLIDL